MTTTKSKMRTEIEEIPAAVERLLAAGAAGFERGGAALRAKDPATIVTIARGSSDHAASFLKYAIELVAGVPVASLGPSIVSIYGRELRLGRAASIAISQSGQSPDIVALAKSARDSGALSFAMTNTPNSPLAQSADVTIDLAAGPERSVAATKSFVNSVVAGLALAAHWREDTDLWNALQVFPATAAAAVDATWPLLLDRLEDATSLYVLGRGPSLAIAYEAALKFKETCGLHAEAYSAAEVLHGPARIVEDDFPVLALVARDAAEPSVIEIVDRLGGQGANVYATTERSSAATKLAFAPATHPITDALSLIVTFYGFVEALSRRRGLDPDNPPHLKKVTETL